MSEFLWNKKKEKEEERERRRKFIQELANVRRWRGRERRNQLPSLPFFFFFFFDNGSAINQTNKNKVKGWYYTKLNKSFSINISESFGKYSFIFQIRNKILIPSLVFINFFLVQNFFCWDHHIQTIGLEITSLVIVGLNQFLFLIESFEGSWVSKEKEVFQKSYQQTFEFQNFVFQSQFDFSVPEVIY